MKKKSILKSIALFALLTVPFMASAQTAAPNPTESAASVEQNLKLTVNGSALLAVFNTASTGSTATSDLSMSLSGASVAGAAISPVQTNSDTRLRISSLVDDGKTRSITATIAPSMANSGTQLFVTLGDPGNFQPAAANAGTSSGEQDLTEGAVKTVVTGIKTCWSGTANTSGYTVTYKFQKKENATFLQSSTIKVTYTISQDA